MALVAYGLGLALIWVLAWGTPTPANVLGGLAVAAVLMAVSPDTFPRRRRGWIRPVAIARFLGFVLVEVLKANVFLTREVLTRESRITTGVVAVPLPDCSDGLLTLVTNVMAVTPGTMPLEVTRDPTVMYVHVLVLGDVEQVRRDVQHLAALAYRAFGSDTAIAAMAELQRSPHGEVAP
jgi:multicomponent Na+:H+ antiporter subunit E